MNGFYWLASYPKSGNTWLRLALWSVKNGGAPVDFSVRPKFAPIASARERFDERLGVESSDLTEEEIANLRPHSYLIAAQETDEPMLCKVHDAWSVTAAGLPLFPPTVTLGSVYIVRDPRDVAVSLSHHMSEPLASTVDFMSRPKARLAAQTQELCNQLPQRLTSWSQHVESWLDAPGRPVLLVRYEDMLADTVGELSRVTKYLGWDADERTLERAVAATRFNALRDAEERQGFNETPQGVDRFFRQGQAGGWRKTLPAELAACIERDHGKVMERLGYR